MTIMRLQTEIKLHYTCPRAKQLRASASTWTDTWPSLRHSEGMHARPEDKAKRSAPWKTRFPSEGKRDRTAPPLAVTCASIWLRTSFIANAVRESQRSEARSTNHCHQPAHDVFIANLSNETSPQRSFCPGRGEGSQAGGGRGAAGAADKLYIVIQWYIITHVVQ